MMVYLLLAVPACGAHAVRSITDQRLIGGGPIRKRPRAIDATGSDGAFNHATGDVNQLIIRQSTHFTSPLCAEIQTVPASAFKQ